MNIMKKSSILAFGLTLACSSLVEAKKFDQLQQLQKASIENGVGTEQAFLLKRLPAPGASAAQESILKALGENQLDLGEIRGTEKSVGKSTLIGADWHLSVYGEGEKIKYRKGQISAGLSEKSRNVRPQVEVADRLSNEELEKIGKSVISDIIGKFVNFSREDEIVPLYSLHEVNSDKSVTGEETSVVSGSVVVFGRKVNGMNVVGAGSKIAVLLSAKGDLEGFDVDWPAYEVTSELIDNLDGAKQKERINAFISKKFENVQLHSVECGYVDFGYRRREEVSNVIQPGCQVSYEPVAQGDKAERIRNPKLDYIPAAAVASVANEFWPELNEIEVAGDTCTQIQPVDFK